MRLAAFIDANAKLIIREWENFALTLVSANESNSPLALRDHISSILAFIADDIRSAQTKAEQQIKSRGKKAVHVHPSAAEIHASIRLAGGFNMDQMVSEYRALRASVINLWEAQLTNKTDADFSDQTRFNESVDQQLTESIHHYTKKLDHSRTLFLGILSHDLRNPLGAAGMSAQLALRMETLQERESMLMTQVVVSVDRATTIVNYLLDLTRARLGSGLPIIREPMDMGFISHVLVDEMRVLHPDRTFTLEISGDMDGEWDKPRIGQVFSNLLGNAVQYGFKDTPINVTVKATDNEVTLFVHNDGVPIPANSIGRIFESMIRGDTGEETHNPGSVSLGLGLYITKEIISAHGGTIEVTSSEKTGTTFIARLPRSAHVSLKPARIEPPRILNLVS